jgi:hypothetical protein
VVDAFSPEEMSPFERWERGTRGVVNLALLVTSGVKELFADDPHDREPEPVPWRGPATTGRRYSLTRIFW